MVLPKESEKISQIKTEGVVSHVFHYDAQGHLLEIEQPMAKGTDRFIYNRGEADFSRKHEVNGVLKDEFKVGKIKKDLLYEMKRVYYQELKQQEQIYLFTYDENRYLKSFTCSDSERQVQNQFIYANGQLSSIVTLVNGQPAFKRSYTYDLSKANTFNLLLMESFTTLPFIYEKGLFGQTDSYLLKSINGSGEWPYTYLFSYEFDSEGRVIGIIKSDNETGDFIDTHYEITYLSQ